MNQLKRIFFSRKARIRWLDCGDANTRFFYKAVLAHQVRNCISYLLDGGGNRIFGLDQIKEMIVAYFKNLLGSEDTPDSSDFSTASKYLDIV